MFTTKFSIQVHLSKDGFFVVNMLVFNARRGGEAATQLSVFGRSAVGRQNTNMHYVYVLKCKNGDLYIGYSDDLKKRVVAHRLGKVSSTKGKRPVELIYYEAYKDKKDATVREYNLKTGQQRELLKKRLAYSIANGTVVK